MEETFQQLRALMLATAKGMIVAKDGPQGLVLHAPIPHPFDPSKPMWFGAVQPMKNYVSYHLMPVYASAAMNARISEALKKRMQGKSCFNFKAPDQALFAELGALTAAGAEAFSKPLNVQKGKRPAKARRPGAVP
jgi:hypothetical protein